MISRLSRQAQTDLRDITAYLIANASKKTAQRISRTLRSAARSVGRSPKASAIVATHLGWPLHRKPVMRWAILYYEVAGEVLIVRIADGSQDYLTWFDQP